jgi:hypothetical protein
LALTDFSPALTMHAFDFILVLFSFVFVGRDLVASRRRQHVVFGRRRLKLIVRRDEQGSRSSSGWRAGKGRGRKTVMGVQQRPGYKTLKC